MVKRILAIAGLWLLLGGIVVGVVWRVSTGNFNAGEATAIWILMAGVVSGFIHLTIRLIIQSPKHLPPATPDHSADSQSS